MILHPAVVSLLTGTLLVCLLALYAAFFGQKILRGWDLKSGSEFQLDLEKKTYLISTMMTYSFVFQILSFFLFIFIADVLHPLFVGAMCAAGTLNVNWFGYPALIVMVINCLLGGTWLVLNYTDNRAFDYPLIRHKYAFLLGMTPFIIGETVLLMGYFLNLKANVITSCCGTLFSATEEGVASGLAAIPRIPMEVVFFSTMAIALASGFRFYRVSKGGLLFSLASVLAFPVSIAALISFISLYFYEMPTHHCPFCILQKEYGYAGYIVYATLLAGAISGAGIGITWPFRSIPSLQEILPGIQKKLAVVAVSAFVIFIAIVLYKMIFSDFILEGY